VCRCSGGGQAGEQNIPLLGDLRTLLPRALVFALMRLCTTQLFDLENPAAAWTLNTAFGAMQQLQELPSVVGDSLALVTTIMGCKYLNHIYMIYNPSDFSELTRRFPWIIVGITFATAVLSVLLAPFVLGSQLASATGVGFFPGATAYVASQVARGAALAFEALMFANVEFAGVARISMLSFVPFAVIMLITWAFVPWTPMLWVSILASAGCRLYLAARHVHGVTIKAVGKDGTTIDEFDALLDDSDGDDDGPEDLEARGLLGGGGGTAATAASRAPNTAVAAAAAAAAGRRSRAPSRPRRARRHSRASSSASVQKYTSYADFEKKDTEFQEAFRQGGDAFSSSDEDDD